MTTPAELNGYIVVTMVSGRFAAAQLRAELNAHINDTADAHDASAISNVAAGNLAAGNVQAALDELQMDVDTRATSASVADLSGVSDAATARANLSLGSAAVEDTSAFDAAGSAASAQSAAISAATALVDDLSGVSDATTARNNLGLGSAAVEDASAFDAAGSASSAQSAAIAAATALVDDLSGVSDATTARTNLGLGSAAVEDTSAFDAAGSAASAQSAAEATAAALVDDLSGVSDATTARSNLGLGSAAVEDSSAFTAAAHAVDTSNPHSVTYAQVGADASGAAAAAQAAAQAYANSMYTILFATGARNYVASSTETDYSANSGAAGFVSISGELLWPDGETGHIDAVEYSDNPGAYQYYTASKNGLIVVQSPPTSGVSTYEVIVPDVYVDSNASAGGDGSYATPYDALSDVTVAENMVIALASNSHFDETISLLDGCGLYRYGAGAKPIVDSGEEFTNGSWTLASGATYTYQQDVAIYLTPLLSFVNVTEDDVFLARVDGILTCESTPGSYAVTTDTGSGDTTVTVWIHPSDSSNPTSNGKTYRYGRRDRSVFTGENCVVDGINTMMQTGDDGSLLGGINATIRHCVAEFGTKHNMLVHDGSTVLHTECRNAHFDPDDSTPNRTLLVLNENDPSRSAVFGEIIGHSDDYDSSLTGILAHNNAGPGRFVSVVIRRGYWHNLDNFMTGIRDCDAVQLTRNYIVECVNGVNSSSSSEVTLTIDNNWIDLSNSPAASAAGIQVQYMDNSVNVIGNYISLRGTAGYGIAYNGEGVLTANENTVIFDGTTGGSRRSLYIQDVCTVDHNNNVYSDGVNNYIRLNVAGTTYTGDGNCYEVDGSLKFYDSGTSYALAGWQTHTGQDANSTIGGCV